MRKIYLTIAAIFLVFFQLPSLAQKTAVEPPFSKTNKEAETLFKQGLEYYDLGDNRMARKSFEQALEKDPTYTSCLLYYGNTSRSSKEYADNFEKSKANMAHATDWDKNKFAIYESSMIGDYNSRVTLSKQLVGAYPNSARAHLDFGNSLSSVNDIKNAREAFRKATKLAPAWAPGYMALASSYLFQAPKDFNVAEKMAQKVVKLAPKSASAHILLGDVYRAKKDLEKARDAYTAAINLQSDSPDGYYKRGHANTYLGSYDAARDDYNHAGKNDDVQAYAAQYSAYTFLYDNDTESAVKRLSEEDSRLVGKDALTQEAKFNLLTAAAFIALHNNDLTGLQNAIEKMEPISKQIGENIGNNEAKIMEEANMLYYKGLAQALKGNFSEAEALAEKMISILKPINSPTKMETYASLMGQIHLREKKYDQAVFDFQKTNENNIYDRYWLAKSYEAAGSKVKALDIYKDIADNNFNSIGYALIRNEVRNKAEH